MATFKARARALDMLGRQQIAGIPTAISELFKNAHDAYADHVEVDFYRSDRLFILRDDGVGMSRKDFENRWLVLGTESKTEEAHRGVGVLPADPEKDIRPLLGEKGIGRLAIAAIGPQVLVLSRPKYGGDNQKIVASFIHWGLFEAPGVDLNEIEIPIVTFSANQVPSLAEVGELVEAVRQNARRLEDRLSKDLLARIESDLDKFIVDPTEFDEILGSPSLSGSGHGTHFFIIPSDESILADVKTWNDKEDPPPLLQALIGFTNTMVDNGNGPRILAVFRDHINDDIDEDLIAPSEFFIPSDFDNADHSIIGEFDEKGDFRGIVSVYGEPHHFELPSPLRGISRVECGPFQLKVGYIPGEKKQSTLPNFDFERMNARLKRIGGLYIYRDGIRVLPYGNADFDFLEFEKRRSLSAGDYFFSYRRMFGAVLLTRTTNTGLTEKAGREGFRQNKAYRQFKLILIHFFVQAAKQFFRKDGSRSQVFNEKRAELSRIQKAAEESEREEKERRDKFEQQLERFFTADNQGGPAIEVDAILSRLRDTLNLTLQTSGELSPEQLTRYETEARRHIHDLETGLIVRKPVSLALPRKLTRQFEAYELAWNELQEEFQRARGAIDEIVSDFRSKVNKQDNTSDRAENRMHDVIRQSINLRYRTLRSASDELNKEVEALRDEFRSASKACTAAVDAVTARVLQKAMDEAPADSDATSFSERRSSYEAEISGVFETQDQILMRLTEQLRMARDIFGPSGEIVTGSAEIMAFRREELIGLREQAEMDLELSHLGKAIEVVNHEFSRSIRMVRQNLSGLKTWSDTNPVLAEIYRDLNASFEHLDAYLTLFTPLHKRLYGEPIEFDGNDIAKFLRDLFGERLEEHDITLEVTKRFREFTITGYPSTFYPVFINLVDNAVYWLTDAPLPRLIRLDGDGDAMIVSDSGPGVARQDREVIFLRGESRRPGGQGMGLYISREVLKRANYNLVLGQSADLHGATFRIEPVASQQSITDDVTE